MSENLTKNELISDVAAKANISKKQAGEILDLYFQKISEELVKGRKFTMTDFGTFTVVSRKPRNGTNPQTGETMVIPGKLVAKFKAGKSLSEKLSSVEAISNWVNK